MTRPISFTVGEYYHLYNRGNSKQDIFLDNADYRRFVRLLFLANSYLPIDGDKIGDEDFSLFKPKNAAGIDESLIDIGAYCLMKNHFHLLVREKSEGGISEFAHKLSTSHVMYFNLRYERTGTLFEGPFKAKHLEDDAILQYQFAYIHLNPVKIIEPRWKEEGIKNLRRTLDFLNRYQYSSYLDYIGKRSTNLILNKKAFPDYFDRRHSFKDFIRDWLTFSEKTKARP